MNLLFKDFRRHFISNVRQIRKAQNKVIVEVVNIKERAGFTYITEQNGQEYEAVCETQHQNAKVHSKIEHLK